jgi:hypothetical protein
MAALPFKRYPASIRDPDTLNREREAAGHFLGLAHHRCEPGMYKTGYHLGREAMHHDKHFLADTARGVGQHFEGTALFAIQHRGCERFSRSEVARGIHQPRRTT